MPRLKNALPKYRKHKASGQAVVTISGRDVYLGKYDSDESREKYDREIKEWLAAGRPRFPPSSPKEITVGEVMCECMREVQTRYVKNGKPTSEQECFRSALRFVKELYSSHPATEFGPLELKTVRQAMVKKDLARKTINQHVKRIRRMFKWAASDKKIPASVYQELLSVEGLRIGESGVRETEPVRPVEQTDIDATLPHLPRTVADMVQVQLLSGMRPGEVTQICPRDLDRSDDVWIYTPKSHKTEHHGIKRTIPIGPKAQEILEPYLLRHSDAYCFCSIESPLRKQDSELAPYVKSLFADCSRNYEVSSYRNAIKRACGRAGISAWKPNQLRHAAATRIRKHSGLEAAQVVLGHANINMTEHYAERDISMTKEAARKNG